MNWFLCLQLTRASPRPGIRTVRSTRPNSANHPGCPTLGGASSLLGSLASPVRPRVFCYQNKNALSALCLCPRKFLVHVRRPVRY